MLKLLKSKDGNCYAVVFEDYLIVVPCEGSNCNYYCCIVSGADSK